MHVALTDVLTCPRCGPAFGLILLARDVRERRVLEGVLGCANCREQYAVAGGGVSLGTAPQLPAEPGDRAQTERLAALLGVTRGPGFVLLVGPATAHAIALSELVADIEVIAISHGAAPGTLAAETFGVSRLGLSGRVLPLATAKALAVALSGPAANTLLEEGARALSPLGHLVVQAPPPDAEKRLQAAGLRVLARDEATLVAAR